MNPFDATLHIVFGTMTGNAEDLATRLAERCESENIAHTITSAEDWDLERFEQAQRIVLVFSTWGDGEPPDDAIDFCEGVYDQKASVSHIEFAVVGLGDSSYEDFCGCARRLDEALAAGGAKRIRERLDLDIDFDKDFDAWVESFIASERNIQRA